MKKIIFFYLFTLTILNAQNYWKPSVQTLKKTKNVAFFTLDKEAFHSALKAENSHTAKRPFSVIIPDYEGNTENFYIQRSQILSPELAQKYPNIKCFVGYSSQNPLKKIRFVWSDFGLNAIIEENFNYSFIQATQQEGNHYKVYLRDNSESPLTECKTTQHLKREKRSLTRRNSFQTSSKIRTFRIAIAATYDYTNFFGGKSQAFAQIVHSINRINQIFGTQLSIQFQLVSDENIIYDSPFNPLSNINYDDWDVYSNTNPSRILQDLLDAQVGETNYDIGHLFHNANLGGNAGCIGCVCESKRKGTAFSSVRFRRGMNLDHFDVDVLCHEIGHQMGAYHTYSHKNEGTGSQKEPGSGSTIMGYAGAIEDGNIQLRSDAYFHHQSVYEITNNVLNKQCAIVTESSNAAPEIGDIRSHTIPKGTAFLLEGRATDPDGDPLLYTWEQSDSRNASHYFFSPYSTQGAIARSLPPSASTQRYIPRLSRIVSGKLTQTNPAVNTEWETILNVGRTLNWSFMVMDRSTSSTQVGNTAYTTIQVAVVNSAGPFEVISHNSPNVWFTGQYQTIIWDVAKTNEAEVNEQEVNVLFSTDGGLSFPHILASKIPNNGKAKIKVPATIITDNGRFMIKAANNIFLAVNKGNINVKMDEDTDGDGITSSLDNCPHMPNPEQADLDNDGIGDLCDDDIDGDDVPNQEDNCLDIPNPNQSDLDNDGIGDLCDDDMDNDGYTNEVDNCPKVYNPDQADLDNDGIGDLCDNDIDGDGIDNQNDKSLDYVLISNAFTPNGDGNNDFYTISRVENYPNNELLIYNQFGQLVYHSKGYKNQWNGIGLNGNKVPQGSYFYIFTLDNTEVYKRQGWLFINY